MSTSDEQGSRREGRGQLRIYLGSAAGVGKTFAMLNEGHRRQERGTEVAVAFVETHGRKHTAALLGGLEIIPRARLSYRDTVFEEMDIDAVLARAPEIALVDEFAHTNVPGSRNSKRWQDVEELLQAGIDVISTVTSSTWSHSTTSSRRSPAYPSGRRSPMRSSARPTRSSSST